MKKIGIPFGFIGTSCGIRSSYYSYLMDYFDDIEIVLLPPVHDQKALDLLILPGGADVLSTRYGGIPSASSGFADPVKEYFDSYWLPRYIETGTPIFGVCRGIQSLNVLLGGSLGETFHKTNKDTEPGDEMHKVYINSELMKQNTYFSSLVKDVKLATFGVNSRHHQGFRLRQMGDWVPLFTDSSKFEGSSTVEAAAHLTYPVVGVTM
jgi:putative glutamine amidotransferase